VLQNTNAIQQILPGVFHYSPGKMTMQLSC
jgi:hypothetical protein